MKPYYDDGKGIIIYHGDCREIVPVLGKFDLLLTDPPYGIELGSKNNLSKDSTHLAKQSYLSYSDTYEQFVEEIVPAINLSMSVCGCSIVWTGPNISEQKKPDAMGGVWCPAATGRTNWGSKNFLPILFYGNPPAAGQHRPTVIRSNEISEVNGHPCPKPIGWISWLITLGSVNGDTILDPFAGSGTTGRAAKDLGRKCTMIEREEKYAEIAAKRMAQEVFAL